MFRKNKSFRLLRMASGSPQSSATGEASPSLSTSSSVQSSQKRQGTGVSLDRFVRSPGALRPEFLDWPLDADTDDSSDEDTSEISLLSSSDSSSSQSIKDAKTRKPHKVSPSSSSSSSSLELAPTNATNTYAIEKPKCSHSKGRADPKHQKKLALISGMNQMGTVPIRSFCRLDHSTNHRSATKLKPSSRQADEYNEAVRYPPHLPGTCPHAANQPITFNKLQGQPQMAQPNGYFTADQSRLVSRQISEMSCTKQWKISKKLAVITQDYVLDQCAHKPVSFQKGDYVYIIKEHLTMGAMTKEHESWIHVRRWCKEHLVATGPPVYVPRSYIRKLTMNEITDSSVRDLVDTDIRPIRVQFAPIHPDPFCHSQTDNLQCNDLQANPTSTEHPPICQSTAFVPTRRYAHAVACGQSSECSSAKRHSRQALGSNPSIGSEIDEFDSGRGLSSGSDWGSGRGGGGGGSNQALDRTVLLDSVPEPPPIPFPFYTDSRQHIGTTQSRIANVIGRTRTSTRPRFGEQIESVGRTSTVDEPDVCLHFTRLQHSLPQIDGNALETSRTTTANTTNDPFPIDTHLLDPVWTEDTVITMNENGDGRPASGGLSAVDWEPYKTVVHLHKNVLEKFTLV